jgi:CheY-like chemotaxis protein
VLADRIQLEQTLLNLATNARDAMPAGGPVQVEVRRLPRAAAAALGSTLAVGDQVLLEVADRGAGMSAEIQARIFEPFFTTKARGRGTGLGLSTVHGIVSQSGGEVFVDSALGAGTRFRVFLPAAEGPPATAAPPPLDSVRGGRERILIVDDNHQLCTLAARVLAAAGYEVLVAPDAAAALVTTRGLATLDLVVTDIVMPGMTGPQLAARLRGQYPALRIVFMSGYFDADHTDELSGLDPARNLLRKPFEPEQLLRCIRAALDPVAAPRPTAANG